MASGNFYYLDSLSEEVRQIIYEFAFAAEMEFNGSSLLTALKGHRLYDGAMEVHKRVSATVHVGNEAEFIELPYERRILIQSLKLIFHRHPEEDVEHPQLRRSTTKLLNNIETLILDYTASDRPAWTLAGHLIHASNNPQRVVARLAAPLKPARRAGLKVYWMYLSNSCPTVPHHIPFPVRHTRLLRENNNFTSTGLGGSQADEASDELFLPREVRKHKGGLSYRFGPGAEHINSKIVGVSGKLLRVSPLQYPEDWFWEDPTGKRLQFVSENYTWQS